jgi:hypothetical protein
MKHQYINANEQELPSPSGVHESIRGRQNKKKQNEKFRQLNIARENICSNLALVRGDILR